MPIHAIITTHTDRHLTSCVRGLLDQHRRPDTIVVSADRTEPSILAALEAMGPVSAPRLLVWRPHQGASRQGQVRNNGVRALAALGRLGQGDGLLFLDGDIVLEPSAIDAHATLLGGGAGLVLAHRAELDEAASASYEPGTPFDACWPADADHALARRAGRARRALRLARIGGRQLGLVKRHKPKVISCHVSVTLDAFEAVNGFDEAFEGHGFEDDDFGRRLYGLRPPPRVAVAIDRIRALHLWHPTRKVTRPADTPQGRRFARRDLPVVADLGVRTPRDQPQPEIIRLDARSESGAA